MLQRILLVSGVALVGLTGFLFGLPSRLAAALPVLGSVAMSRETALLLASAIAVFFGALRGGRAGWRHSLESALLPALLTLGLGLAARVLPAGVSRWAVVAGLATLLPLTLLVEQGAQGAGLSPALRPALRSVLCYVAALALFTGIYGLRLRALMTSPLIGVAAAALAWLTWRDLAEDALSALIVGLVVAELAWPLLYWPVEALVGGMVLLAAFHVATGLLGTPRRERMGRLAAAEYVVVGLVALAVIITAVLRVR